MILLEEVVPIRWSNVNKARYIDRGYNYTKNGDVFYPMVKDVIDCSKGNKIPVKCDYCGKVYYPTVRNYLKVHNKKEKDCCVSCKGIKIRKTVQQKYGVDNIYFVPEIQEKITETCMKKFGTPSPLENKEIFQKTAKSFNEHYGTKNGIKDLRSVKSLSEKISRTNIEKFGGVSPFCNEAVRQNIRKILYENGSCPTSKKQIALYKILKEKYGNCELNYPCDKVSLDCMVVINNQKIDVEYDGWYWHKDKQEQDKRRNFFVESKGYKVFRILAYADRLPTILEIEKGINFLTQSSKKFFQIELR